MANQICLDADVLANIAEKTSAIMVSLKESSRLDLSLRLFAKVVGDVHKYLLDLVSRGPQDEDGRSQGDIPQCPRAAMPNSRGEEEDGVRSCANDLQSWYAVSQPKLSDSMRSEDAEEQTGFHHGEDNHSQSDAAGSAMKQPASDHLNRHGEDRGWSNDEIFRHYWFGGSRPEQPDCMSAPRVDEEKCDSEVAHEVEEAEEEEQEERAGREGEETRLEREQEEETAEMQEEKEEEAEGEGAHDVEEAGEEKEEESDGEGEAEEDGEGRGSGMSKQDRLEYDGNTRQMAGAQSYQEGRIIVYRRIACPTGGDGQYKHAFPPAVYLASLQFLSTLRCVMWEVFEPLMDRYRRAARGIDCKRWKWKHRLWGTTAMQSMGNFKKHGRDIMVCTAMVSMSSGQSLPEMGALARLIEWLPRVDDGTQKYSMEKVTKVIFKRLVTDGGESEWYPYECIRPLVHFMRAASAVAGEDFYVEVEADVVKGVDQSYLFDLSCAWSLAEAENRLEVQTSTSWKEERTRTGATGSRQAQENRNGGGWSSIGGKDGRWQSQRPPPWRRSNDDERGREVYYGKRARGKWQ